MKRGMYVSYDLIALEAGPIFLAKNDAVALRMYNQLLERETSVTADEYELRCVGVFDTETCNLEDDILSPGAWRRVVATVNTIESEYDESEASL